METEAQGTELLRIVYYYEFYYKQRYFLFILKYNLFLLFHGIYRKIKINFKLNTFL